MGHIGECSEAQDMDCRVRLRPGCHYQEAFEFVVQSLRNPTDLESDTIRKSTTGSNTYKKHLRRNPVNFRKTAVLV